MGYPTVYFRYRGTFDYKRMYKEGRAFFVSRGMKLIEKKVKYKADEFEGVWAVEHKIDAYFMYTYDIEWHAFDATPTTLTTPDGKQIPAWNAKLMVKITPGLSQHYREGGLAGGKSIFSGSNKEGEESWLHRIYKRIIFRDVDDMHEAEIIIFAHRFIELIKSIANTDSQGSW